MECKIISINIFHIPSWKILFNVPAAAPSPQYIQALGSPGPHWAEEVIKQDAKPLLSDSRDTDLLLLISDGFYLPDKCQKYHSPSAITLATQPTFSSFPSPPPFPFPFPSLRTVNGGAASETPAILQLSVKPWYRRELTARSNPQGEGRVGRRPGRVTETSLDFHKKPKELI